MSPEQVNPVGSLAKRAISTAWSIVMVVGVAVGLRNCIAVTSAANPVVGETAARSDPTAGEAVFPPISQPSVVALVGSGILVLAVLVFLKLRDGDDKTTTTDIKPQHRDASWEPNTDAERVEKILLSNDGQIKQSRIVEKTDWSKAKVSRLLSRMAENDRIRKDKNGRENTIILKD
jgi:hypothetical protein